jgi:SAM-dependent methyltransferase
MAEFFPYISGSVAEVGAGVGNLSKLILEANINSLTAFEPSGNMYPLLMEALGADKRAKAINGFFGQEQASGNFDSVLYVNVLEHIEDDASELARVRTALTAEGHLLIFVPALPCLYSELDRQVGHFRRYTKKSLVALTQRAGFSIVKARYFDVAGIIPWYINFTLLKNTISGGSVSLYDRLVVPPNACNRRTGAASDREKRAAGRQEKPGKQQEGIHILAICPAIPCQLSHAAVSFLRPGGTYFSD